MNEQSSSILFKIEFLRPEWSRNGGGEPDSIQTRKMLVSLLVFRLLLASPIPIDVSDGHNQTVAVPLYTRGGTAIYGFLAKITNPGPVYE